MTSRGPLPLAALASAAVPGLDPDTVQGVVAMGPADPFEVAFVQDRDHRRWVIRCPRTPAASAQLERSAALLAVLTRRLTMPVPAVKGWAALPEGGRAAVHSYLTGRMVSLESIEPGSSLARGLGRALAHLHNLDPAMYEEAGVPVYDAAGYRSRRLAELDRAAATGRVPTGLLGRWERVLDDEASWTFTTTPTHGDLSADTILATPDDGKDPRIKTFLGWESAQVADPADDIAPLFAAMDAEAFETVMEAYAHTRVERPDGQLHRRAEIIGEMQLVRTMMALVAAGDDEGAEASATALRRLDERIARDEAEAARIHGRAATGAAGAATSGATQTAAADAPADDSTSDGTSGTSTTTEEIDLPRPGSSDRPSTQPTGSGGASAGTSGDEDDAVQVEHPAQVTRVTPATGSGTSSSGASGSVPSASDDSAPGTHEPNAPEPDTGTAAAVDTAPEPVTTERSAPHGTGQEGDGPETDEPETNPTLRAVPAEPADVPAGSSADATDPTAGRARGNDHETAEIVPIDDDGDDDVVPPRR